jgi:ABC-type sugar transport system substrate-binding protein
MRARRSVAVVAAAVAASGCLMACGDDDEGASAGGGTETEQAAGGAKPSVGVIIKGLDNPFFASMRDGIKQDADAQGVKVTIQAAASITDTSGQASKLETVIGQKPGCLVVNPISQTNLVQPLARAADIPIVNIDSPISADAAKAADLSVATYIGTDNEAAGGLAAEAMGKAVGEKGGKVGVIGGLSGDATSAARVDGFKAAAGEHSLTPLTTVAGDWDRQKAQTAAEDILRANPDLTGFFAANDQMALGIGQAVRDAKRADDVAVIGVDGIEDALNAIERGTLTATVSQYPYTIGQLGVRACVAAAAGKDIPAKFDAPVQVVDKDNVAKAKENFPEPVDAFEDPFGG